MGTWLILPVVICLSQRLSHACLSISEIIQWDCGWLIKSVIVYLMVLFFLPTWITVVILELIHAQSLDWGAWWTALRRGTPVVRHAPGRGVFIRYKTGAGHPKLSGSGQQFRPCIPDNSIQNTYLVIHSNSIGSHHSVGLFTGGQAATIHSNFCPINFRW